MFHLLIVSRNHNPIMMARTKQTPRNPNINRPKATIGSDVQEGRPTPRLALSKTPIKGGRQPWQHLSQKLLCLGTTATGGIKNPTDTDLEWWL